MADERFYRDIRRFNEIYQLPNHENPTPIDPERIANFRKILKEEIEEGQEIEDKYRQYLEGKNELSAEEKLDVLTDMSDWLGDIIVYCASEARRWGLPLERVLNVIMESNFSKLDRDGNPIYDERGKVLKGPDYWKPEPKIREVLSKSEADSSR